MMHRSVLVLGAGFLLSILSLADNATSMTLEKQLGYEHPRALAVAAEKHGDAQRGALLFYRPQIGCIKCHAIGGVGSSLGPDLTRLAKETTGEHLVESVLLPSKVIAKGHETLLLATTDGRAITGLLVEENDKHVNLRDGTDPGKLISLPKSQVESRAIGKLSLMPAALVNNLSSRQEFLDLIAYLMAIRDGGLARAKELEPPPAAYALKVPDYEAHIDHAGLIRDLDEVAFRRGEAIYSRLCVNCHGTHHDPGSLPNSLRFAKDKFKNGSDPHSMYRTLTHGYGLMTPQPLVPVEKYDVIHFIREAYLRGPNKSQYVPVNATYLAQLPKGNTRGPRPLSFEPWLNMDYGPHLIHTYEAGNGGKNIAYKGIAVRVDPGPGGVAQGGAWMLFDHDTLRLAAAWTGKGFIDWHGVQFNGRHNVHPRLAGEVHCGLPIGPGWANPETGIFTDPRPHGRDDRPYGPLPRTWARYRGLYHHGQRVILSYSVGDAALLETFGLEAEGKAFTRTLELSKATRDLLLRVAAEPVSVVAVGPSAARLEHRDGFALLHIPANATPLRLKLLITKPGVDLTEHARRSPPPEALAPLTRGGPKRWSERLSMPVLLGRDDGPFAVDVLLHPEKNPWHCQLRFTGLDFSPDGKRLAACTWDGDVWLVSGLDRLADGLTWQRIASGLFQPLGLKIIDGRIHVTCRDQLVRLHDLNGDEEIDFYENINNDHQVTEHFHEFAMGLQTDAAGNFYYAKSARHALPALVPHHGTLLRVSKDGSRTDILATGFRAANGVCLNPDGTFFVTDQEGHWTPKNRINWVREKGFYGNMFGYHSVTDTSDSAMEPPVCWITNGFDRSPAELLWVPSDRWGPLAGSLLNLSYGYGKVFVVPHEKTPDGRLQGGMVPLPIPQFPTGVMRGRFHPGDGQLYLCGMYSWAGNQQQPGGLYRLRYTDRPVHIPTVVLARKREIALGFPAMLDRSTLPQPNEVLIKTWQLKRSADYGSPHQNERRLSVSRVELGEDDRTLHLEVPDLQPTMCLEVRLTVRGKNGELADVVYHGTIHKLGDR
jgi:putative heme-binding domain-containing protein